MTTRELATVDREVDATLKDHFPPGFLWGAGTSAYQVEGSAHQDGRGPSIWDRFSHTPGNVSNGDTGDIAADAYARMEDDVALMARLGLSAYRFSVAWPRVLPQGIGDVNAPGLDFYDRLVDALLEHEIEPMVTLYHWDLPLALQDRGGWLNRATAEAFAAYAEIVARRLGDRVKLWTTHNEPFCAAYLGHATGELAPGLHNRQAAFVAAHHLLVSHGMAVERLRAVLPPTAKIGVALDFAPVYPVDARIETLEAAARADRFRNRWFADPIFRGRYPRDFFAEQQVAPPPIEEGDLRVIAARIDFLGVNYYSCWRVASPQQVPPAVVSVLGAEDGRHERTGMGWEVFPQGLTDLLAWLHEAYAPAAIYVTENGAAFADTYIEGDTVADPARQAFIAAHIEAGARALARGVPLRGYFVWSLLDNFEWAHGYAQRFGLVYIDYPSQRRLVKQSGRWYGAWAAARRLPTDRTS
jgi:beta-glucosidase